MEKSLLMKVKIFTLEKFYIHETSMIKFYTIMGQDSHWIKSIKFFRVSMNYTRKTKIKENDQTIKD